MAQFNSLAPAVPLTGGAGASTFQDALRALATAVGSVKAANALLATSSVADMFTSIAALDVAIDAVGVAAADVASMAPGAPPPPPAAPAAPAPALGSVFRSGAPWRAGLLYIVTPAAPLAAVPDNGEKWYAITRGRYVGITKNSAVSLNATTGISSGLSEKMASQQDALDHFNTALESGAIAVTQV
ncbi:hypothetical protein DFH06DRAFT_1350562 [Mycena polygramma]|nr:hypothetical protein DFH06DRAFT_1352966 [Mycena polygramma]KAJ7603090.1 hypothetical protein DFH06DRAFT_1350562 [Mycena polygramma]